MQINSLSEFRAAMRYGPYAWPGGYPLYFVTSDGAALSFDAAKQEKRNVIDSIVTRSNDGWRIVGMDINWEDQDLYCDHTGKRIESAYGDEDALSD
jgi:hypothetical protein